MEMAKNGKLPSNLQGQYNNLINKYGLSHDVISAALSDSKDTKNAALNAAKQKMKADRLAGTQAAANVHVGYMNPYQGLQGKARTDGHGGIIILNRDPNSGDVKFDHVSERNAQISGVDEATARQISAEQNSHNGNKRQERIDKERETRQKRQEAKINEVLNKDPSKRTPAEERRVNEYLKQQELKNNSKASGRFKNKNKVKAPSGGGGGGGRSASTAANVAKGEAEGWFKRNRRKLGLAAAALGTLGGGYAAYQHYKDRD